MALKIHSSARAWESQAQGLSVFGLSLHDHTYQSGSNVDMEQFLLLRAFWPSVLTSDKFLGDCKKEGWIAEAALSSAKKQLEGLSSWKKYTESFRSSAHIRKKETQGIFSLVRYYQHFSTNGKDEPGGFEQPKVHFTSRVTRSQTRRLEEASRQSPSRPPRSPDTPPELGEMDDMLEELSLNANEDSIFATPLHQTSNSPLTGDLATLFKAVEDEQIVNTALILFLNAITLQDERVAGEWSLYRKPFTVRHPRNRQKLFEARVDGLFRANAAASLAPSLK
ncbi:hypothetical protein B0T10DRAFT_573227 [Thelonectria olida]|uniref:Uncharacterized protein n=1 Tax=Thelonectria olida TaxID=1576542 RepID=A0A9P9ALA6_9HYPO|nr:hypothetical protein B0T10DRAFT_573227 [Thelonectria olida]